MAKNEARRQLDARGASKQQRSHRRGLGQGSSARRNKQDDPAVRRAREKETDPRLQRAAAELAEHEAQLRALEERQAAGGTVLHMPAPAPAPTADVVQLRPAPARRRSVRPDPAAWAAALAILARDGSSDVRRIQVLDRDTLLVRNRRRS